MTHSTAFGGNTRINKTISHLFMHYYPFGMTKEVKNIGRSCTRCQTTSSECKIPKAHIQVTNTCHPDHLKMWPWTSFILFWVPTDRDNTHILTMVEICTRFTEAILWQVLHQKQHQTHYYWSFLGSVSQVPSCHIMGHNLPPPPRKAQNYFLQKFVVHQLFSSPYHSQTNGIVEKFYGTLKAVPTNVTLQQASNWDVILPAVLSAFR